MKLCLTSCIVPRRTEQKQRKLFKNCLLKGPSKNIHKMQEECMSVAGLFSKIVLKSVIHYYVLYDLVVDGRTFVTGSFVVIV
ncbi:hypothetical protein Y032_0680g1473 [Ancylostoma ceylanicum]|uniref:Uncharacterized protein n=1 Tax=Ancylostoma ceylanicum TaxID=53326 RepID=A0A016WJ89_9BILA|nr:hypothetical protein Y032_0680g1473 [Ancylostoma ceylanicum]